MSRSERKQLAWVAAHYARRKMRHVPVAPGRQAAYRVLYFAMYAELLAASVELEAVG